MINKYTSLNDYPKPVLDVCYSPLTQHNIKRTLDELQDNLSYYNKLLSDISTWTERNSNPLPQYISEFEDKLLIERDNARGIESWLSHMLACCETWEDDE